MGLPAQRYDPEPERVEERFKRIATPLLISLGFHFLFFLTFPLLHREQSAHPPGSALTRVTRVRFPPLKAQEGTVVPQELLPAPQGQVVDVMDDRNVSKTAPKDSRFLSDKNRSVDQETQARFTGPNPTASRGLPGEEERPAGASRNSGKSSEALAPFGEKAAPKGSKGKLDLSLPESFLEKEAPSSRGGSVAALAPSNYLPEIAMGDETLLDTREYSYASFFIRMKRQMEGVWNPRRVINPRMSHRNQYVTRVDIALNRDGTLASVRLIGTSGEPGLDEEALSAVRRGAPYLNPPPELVDATGKIRIPEWHFIVTLNAMF